MIKPFLALTLLLMVMVLTITFHYTQFSKKQSLAPLLSLSQLTLYSKLSLSVSYDEQQFNPTYPEMQSLRKVNFIYE